MAKNTGNGVRQGTINNRTQTYNPKTGQFIKRNENGQFIANKKTPFKNVRREQKAKDQEKKPQKE